MIILGIDPGYERLGVAILEKENGKKPNVIFSECFKTSAKEEHTERLFQIQAELEKVIKKYKPTRLGIETLFFNTNQKTATKVSEARGVILATSKKFDLEIKELSPLQVKVGVTGYGKSDKTAVIKMIPLLVTFNSKDIKKNNAMLDDEYDAIAVAFAVS